MYRCGWGERAGERRLTRTITTGPSWQAYAAKLAAQGVPVRHKVYEGLIHAYAMYFDLFPEAAATAQDVVAFLKEGL